MLVECESFKKAADIIAELQAKEMDLEEQCTKWGEKTRHVFFHIIYRRHQSDFCMCLEINTEKIVAFYVLVNITYINIKVVRLYT